MKLGIENTEKMFNALIQLSKSGEKIWEDKKVNLDDLPEFIGLFSKLEGIVEGVKGAKDSFEELKELNSEEAQLVVAKVYELFAAISGNEAK